MAGGVAGEVFVEFGRTARAVGRTVWRRLPGVLVGFAVLATFLSVVGFVGAVVDDVAISRNRATATAEVLEGSTFARTLVRFPVPDGQLLVPERGVYHPRGLEPGTTVRVEYDRTEPDLVRVAGRTALSGLPLTIGFVALAWALFGGAAALVRRGRQAAHHE
ncbi:DUF3592 domain-containing protein [Pseudonocardia sp. RS010]|uniref:DUF3592 domain-containing protein n=1 Tax=Pseudonocardia sp. RS010 TaxID=3385979 RepID=UPI0039A10B3A